MAWWWQNFGLPVVVGLSTVVIRQGHSLDSSGWQLARYAGIGTGEGGAGGWSLEGGRFIKHFFFFFG